jgi:HAD superfamily hydrolase (TIGR01548 family)
VGYVAGAPELIGWLAAAGNPYTVTGPSARLAAQALREGDERMADFVASVRRQRGDLERRLDSLGLAPTRSQGNFAFARTMRADWLREALASLGIGVRGWPGVEGLADGLRFTLPGNDADYERLVAGIETALRPEALLLDMDGVLADVRHSYRAAIVQTCAAFGVQVTAADVQEVKDAGDANNDWVVSQRLLAARGVDADLEAVTQIFESLYQGTQAEPGLRARETLLIDRATLEAMRRRVRLAVVTGRPRKDAVAFLQAHDLADLFEPIVCMEDGPAKPDPAPVRLALQQLGVTRAWMLGDTPDDAVSARAAGVVAIGVVAPGDEYAHADEVQRRAGAARVLERPADIQELLP